MHEIVQEMIVFWTICISIAMYINPIAGMNDIA